MIVLSALCYGVTSSGPALLDDLQRRAFDFFVEHSHPKTGLTKDRAINKAGGDAYTVASAASTGFALTAYVIGTERKWMNRADAKKRTVTTLKSINDLVEGERGWLYHFVNWETGKREWKSEASTIDTSILLAGVFAAERYWKDKEITQLSERFWNRIDWKWALTDGGKKPNETLIGHGWKPEEGFLSGRWSAQYSEEKMLYIMGCGLSDIRTDGWETIGRKYETYKGIEFITGGPLFIHQMSEGFFSFKGMRDKLGVSYFVSTKNATLANRQYCIDNPKNFKGYGADFWGLSACDHPGGYNAFGAPGWIDDNGTITPTSAVASMPFTPKESLAFAEAMRKNHPAAWGKYGFPNGYNPNQNWIGPDVIGIDLGMMMLGIEAHRTGLIHKLTMSHPAIKRGYERVGLKPAPGSDAGPLRVQK
ncbi:Domain of unknown function DUF2329 [Fimbriimonadaceae bacterium]